MVRPVCCGFLLLLMSLLIPVEARAEPRTLEDVLTSLAREPTVEQVQHRALEYAHLEPSRATSFLKRSRWSGMLPRVELAVERGLERDEDLDRAYEEMDELSVGTDDDIELRAVVRWDLDRLIFDPEELRASRQALDHARNRRELLRTVTRLYFELLEIRAIAAIGIVESDMALRVERAVRASEIRSLLDGLTGGVFGALREE